MQQSNKIKYFGLNIALLIHVYERDYLYQTIHFSHVDDSILLLMMEIEVPRSISNV